MAADGWLLDTDEALKAKLTGVSYTDKNGDTRTIPVYFGMPEAEQRSFVTPAFVIELVDIRRDAEREHRGQSSTQVIAATPQATPSPIVGRWEVKDYPIPVNVDYQIGMYSRNGRLINRMEQAIRNYDRIPERFGYLNVEGTLRRLEMLNYQRADTFEQNKRIFRRILTVRVPTSITQSVARDIYEVASVVLDLHDLFDPEVEA